MDRVSNRHLTVSTTRRGGPTRSHACAIVPAGARATETFTVPVEVEIGESVDRWSYTDTDGEEVQVVEDDWDLQKKL